MNFQKKTPDTFEKTESIWSHLDQRKYKIYRLLAFLKQQSGESGTETPRLEFNFHPQTRPEMDTDWLKWKSKAEELFRIHETIMALKLYHRSILLFKREYGNDTQHGNLEGVVKFTLELAKL